MADDSFEENGVENKAPETTRRVVMGLVGVAAGVAATAPTQAAAAPAEPGASARIVQQLASDPLLLAQLEGARSGVERQAILAKVGLRGTVNPREIQTQIQAILMKHSRGKVEPHEWASIPVKPGGPMNRPVDWVGALATAAAIFAA